MAGGSLTITVPTYAALQTVAQRVTCWAGGVGASTIQRQIQILSNTPAIVIPEALASIGALTLKVGGADLWSGYVPGTFVTVAANNGVATYQNPDTCAASPALPSLGAVTMNVGSNPLAVNVAWLNTGNGTVNITWGDGTSTLGAAEDSNANHTYPYRPGIFTVRIADATAPTTYVETQIYVP